ncbi:MAG: hypothetical protein GKR94_02930 [Gammaproteobacteria bacterium]|nr:hypothetical protein [Gammaproteobacteria bacterium]
MPPLPLRSIIIALVLAWCAMFVLAPIGFYSVYATQPDALHAVLGLTVMSPFAMPLSFVQTCGFLVSPGGAVPLLALYWLALGGLHYLALVKRSGLVLAVVMAILLASGWRLQVNAQGLLGI